MDYQYIYIINHLILAVFTLIISKFIYSLLKKENKIIKSLLFFFNNYSDFNFVFFF